MVTKFSGADWLEKEFKREMSPFGRDVADLLGQVYAGIYHIHSEVLHPRADWSDERRIEITTFQDLSTYDFDILTKLVVLAHDMAIRLTIAPASSRYLRLIFHKREREGHISRRHPSLEQAVEGIRERIGLGIVISASASGGEHGDPSAQSGVSL
jgi:hypothetical protein